MYEFKLPDIGEGTHEAEILQWLVAVGDEINEDDALVEIQSDKAAVELPSPVSGVVRELFANEGEMALVGSVILTIDTGDGSDGAAAPAPEAKAEEAPASEAAPAATPAPAAAAQPAAPQSTGTRELVHAEDVDIRLLAVPRVRHFAREKGIDLRTIQGTGRSGLITMDDVTAALSGAPAPAPAAQPAAAVQQAPEPAPASTEPAPAAPSRPQTPEAGERRVAMSSIRKATAKALTHTVTTVPHVTIFDQTDVTDLMAHRAKLKVIAADQGVKLTYLPYMVKACVAMLKNNPGLNAYVDMDAGEIVYRSTYHIGIAANTDEGLFVPVVRDADRLSLFEIATEIDRLVGLAKAGKLTRADMSGGSMTITNVGGAALGGVWSTPIINTPESCILGVGRIEEQFMPDEEGQPVLKPMMKLSYVFDHRLVDGVAAQQSLNSLHTLLSNPDLLLAES